jgi:hypothetical protein
MRLNDETIKKIVNELFELYHNSEIREPIIKKFLQKYGINNEDKMWKFLIKAEDMGLITICASPYKYGEIYIVKGNLREKGNVVFKI